MKEILYNGEKMKLHLGCGNVRIDGYINIDKNALLSPDVIDDIRQLEQFNTNTISVIYICHTLEHLTRFQYSSALKRWYQLLKKGGVLRISVPDMENLCKYYIETGDLNLIRGTLYGGQDYKENFHHWGWDFNELSKDLEHAGFKEIKRYDWQKTEHSNVKDGSCDHLPRHDKNGNELSDEEWFKGKLVSLNVEAIK